MVLVARRIGRLGWTLGIMLMAALLSGCALRNGSGVASTPQQVQQRLDSFPLGTLVEIRLENGERVRGMLTWIDAENVSVEVKPGETSQIARASIVEMSQHTTRGRNVGNTLLTVFGAIALAWITLVIVGTAYSGA